MRRPLRVGLLGLALLAACPGRIARPYPEPGAQTLLDHLARRAAALRSIRVPDAKVDYLSDEGRVKLPFGMIAERPARLRLDARSPVAGRVESTLTVEDGRFQQLDLKENRLLTGAADPCNVARVLRIPMRPEDVVDLLLGGAPRPPAEAGPPTVRWDAERGLEVLAWSLPDGGRYELGLDGRSTPPTWDARRAARLAPDGAVAWAVEHDGFRDVAGVRLPERTRYERPREKLDVQIRWREQEVNVAPPAAAFRIEPPPGMRPETVSCRAG